MGKNASTFIRPKAIYQTPTKISSQLSGALNRMGTWGIYIFENDSACEALSDSLALDNPFPTITEVLLEASTSEAQDSYDSVYALAYTLLLLGLRDWTTIEKFPENELTDYVKEQMLKFVTKNSELWEQLDHNQIFTLAWGALEQAMAEESELRELWGETDELENWLAVVRDVQAKI